MADIVNVEAIRYVNEVLRPLAEKVRALKLEIDTASIQWFSGMNEVITNDSSKLEDGREAEGVSRLVGSDLVNLITQLLAIQTALNQAGVANVIQKPCVRVIEVR